MVIVSDRIVGTAGTGSLLSLGISASDRYLTPLVRFTQDLHVFDQRANASDRDRSVPQADRASIFGLSVQPTTGQRGRRNPLSRCLADRLLVIRSDATESLLRQRAAPDDTIRGGPYIPRSQPLSAVKSRCAYGGHLHDPHPPRLSCPPMAQRGGRLKCPGGCETDDDLLWPNASSWGCEECRRKRSRFFRFETNRSAWSAR